MFRKKWALPWNILHFHWQNEFKVIFNPICISVTGLLLVTMFTISYLFMITNKWFDNSKTWLTSGSTTIKLISSENRRYVNIEWQIINIQEKKKQTKSTAFTLSMFKLDTVRITVRLKLTVFVRMLSHSFTCPCQISLFTKSSFTVNKNNWYHWTCWLNHNIHHSFIYLSLYIQFDQKRFENLLDIEQILIS